MFSGITPILSNIWQFLLSVKWRHMFSYEVKTGPIYGQSSKLGGSPKPVACKIVHGRIK